jgi:capsular polysaccharide biosynthesis protein
MTSTATPPSAQAEFVPDDDEAVDSEAGHGVTSVTLTRRLGFALVLAPFVIAAVVFVVSSSLPSTYSSSALVRVSVVSPQGVTDPSVAAENDVASQYALLGQTSRVIDPAAVTLGVPAGTLSSAVSVGTTSGRNLIDVRATAPTAAAATQRANAVAQQFVETLTSDGQRRQADYLRRSEARIAPLAIALHNLAGEVRRSTGRRRDERVNLLSALITQRQTLRSQIASNAVLSLPTIELWAPADKGLLQAPRPKFYALIALLLGALLAGYAAYALRRRQYAR